MNNFKFPSISSFKTQEEVDQYVMETESLVDDVIDEESAIKLFKRISILKNVSEIFFVPEIVFSWEELALCYIESNAAVFECVYYEQIAKMHKQGFDAFRSLEQHVLNDMIPKDAFFGMVHGFNMDVKQFNKYCKKYHQKTFDYYKCSNDSLQQEYTLWIDGVF